MKSIKVAIVLFLSITGALTGGRATAGTNDEPVALTGAWRLQNGGETHQLFFQDGFYLHTVHQGNEFISSQGGNYKLSGQTLKGKVLYDTSDSSRVGTMMNVGFNVADGKLYLDLPDGQEVSFNKVDEGRGALSGVWRITERKGADGKMAEIHQTGTRQTYKLLTGTKFQWVAIDPGKKQFSGTGGGSYTFKDGKYTEHIEFFSRDNSRVGASLSFDGKLEDGKWHHSGLSSKGDPIYEVWSRIE